MNKDKYITDVNVNAYANTPMLIKDELKYKGRFLQIYKQIHELPNENKNNNHSSQHIAEVVKYTLPKEENKPNGIGIIAIIKQTKKIVLIENFRFPIDKKCIEFPSGIIDKEDYENEDEIEIAKQAGKRELLEETGYEGDFVRLLTVPSIPKPMTFFSNIYHDPWKSDGSTAMALFTIDLDKPTNKNPKQALELEELIIKYEVEINSLLEFITDKISNEGYSIRSDLYSFALGLNYTTLL